MDQQQEGDSKPHPRRIWSKKGTSSSKALYEIATTPQRVVKETIRSTQPTEKASKRAVEEETQDLLQQMRELSLQMKQDLEQIRTSGTTSSQQVNEQHGHVLEQIQKLTDIANRHDDEIDDLRGMSDFTHELVLEREQKENMLKMVIKSWPKEATYEDRVRVTDWLLWKASVQGVTKQEHGYYTAGKKFSMSPVSILTFQSPDDHNTFEKYAYGNFSSRWPLYYWDAKGNYSQHWKGGWHKLVITNHINKVDLTINLALTTLLHILTAYENTGYTGATYLSHRPTDKQIYDLDNKKVIAKATYVKDRGVLALVVHNRSVIQILEKTWHEAWRTVHKDHPRYPTYNRYPYAVTFAEARLDEDANDRTNAE